MRVSIIGSGMAGATAARLLTDAGHKVTVFETRGHIGGNCYDEFVDGVLVHKYGPHGFHTDKEYVWNFLKRFTKFHNTRLEVVARTSMGIIPIPFNDVSEALTGELTGVEIQKLIFEDYSEKHWGVPWVELPNSIKNRIPQKRSGSDCRYHLDEFQGIPENGYSKMFDAMLDGIAVHLNCHPNEWRKFNADHTVFTGSIDEYYDNIYGNLEYRSLRFEYSRESRRKYFQINECNMENLWTRSVDHSHWLDQSVSETIIAKEFPCEYNHHHFQDGNSEGNVQYYPKPFHGNVQLFQKYRDIDIQNRTVTFLGRLATYKYLDMDDVIAQVFGKLSRAIIPEFKF